VRTLARVAMLVTALLVAQLATAAAQANTGSTTAAGGDMKGQQHCRIVLDKLHPGEQFSKVISQTCADRRDDLHINAGTLLIIWWLHADYQGYSLTIEGAYGPCDLDGYGIRDTGNPWDPFYPYWWRNNISSFKLYNSCNYAALYKGINYGGYGDARRGNQSNLGGMNDQVRSIRLRAV
jgi:hypothetical protein